MVDHAAKGFCGNAANAGRYRLALVQVTHIGFEHLADDPHPRRIDDVIQVVGRVHDLPDADVGVRDDAADGAGDGDEPERLHRCATRCNVAPSMPKARELLSAIRSSAVFWANRVPRFQQRSCRRSPLGVETPPLLDQLAAKSTSLRLQHGKLERLQLHAHNPGQLLSR